MAAAPGEISAALGGGMTSERRRREDLITWREATPAGYKKTPSNDLISSVQTRALNQGRVRHSARKIEF